MSGDELHTNQPIPGEAPAEDRTNGAERPGERAEPATAPAEPVSEPAEPPAAPPDERSDWLYAIPAGVPSGPEPIPIDPNPNPPVASDETPVDIVPTFAIGVEPPVVRWRALDLGLFVGFLVGWLLVSQVLSLFVYVALRPRMGWTTPILELGDNAFFAVAAQTFYYIPVVIFIVILVKVRHRDPFWEGISWGRVSARQAFRLGFGGVVLAIGVLALSALLPAGREFPLEKLFSSTGAAYVMMGFAVFAAPFMEELIFRGVFFAFLDRLWGVRVAVAATALLFAVLHLPEYWGAWSHVVMILVVGIVLSLTRAITRAVAPSVVIHMAYNATLMALLYIGTEHFHNFNALGHGR